MSKFTNPTLPYGPYVTGPQLLQRHTFNPTNVTNARWTQPFYAGGNLNTLKPQDACHAFLDPVNYYNILERFPKHNYVLRIMVATI